jgi:hypothetical protein
MNQRSGAQPGAEAAPGADVIGRLLDRLVRAESAIVDYLA